MTKRIVQSPVAPNQELMQFMIGELGGENVVMERFFQTKIIEIRNESGTIKDLLDEASRKGWSEMLGNMTLKALVHLLSPTPSASREKSSSDASPNRARISKAEVEEIKERVLGYLSPTGSKSKAQIAGELDIDPRKLTPQLRALRDEGKVRTEGERGGMRYSLVE